MFRVGIDAVNKTAQFKLKDNVSAITLDILGTGGQKLNFSTIGENLNVRIELIRKNQPNVTLTDLPLNELSKVVDILYKGGQQMNTELSKYLIYYNTMRRHGSLRRELGVKTPLQALEKWYKINPNIFYISPLVFSIYLTNFVQNRKQPCET